MRFAGAFRELVEICVFWGSHLEMSLMISRLRSSILSVICRPKLLCYALKNEKMDGLANPLCTPQANRTPITGTGILNFIH